MRTLIMLAVAVLLAGCATPQPTSAIVPVAPPTPVPMTVMKKQSFHAVAALSVSFSAPDNSSSTNYAVATRFALTNELGQKSFGVRIQWPNWPTNTPYAIQKSTNLVDWDGSFIVSQGDAGATLEVIDQDSFEFYRIVSP